MLRGVKATLLKIYKKAVTFDKRLNVMQNGEDNLYPEKADRFINNSVTAKTCAKIMASFIGGSGWGEDVDKKLVNPEKKLTLKKFTNKISQSIAKQRGVFIHANYNLNFVPSSYSVLPYTDCRLGKQDDNNYVGKIGVSTKWADKKITNKDITYIDVFNPNKEVVEAQVMKCKGSDITEKIQNYKGQVLYLNLDDDYLYALSQIDAVMKDCDSEAQASVFKNKSLRKGFFGKTMVITRPLVGREEDYLNKEEYHKAGNERRQFRESIKDFIGAENQGGVFHMEIEYDDAESLEKAILFKNIETDINDKLFEYTESSVFHNILMAFNSIPPALVRPENSVFSASGESIESMKRVYQDNTSQERAEVEQLVQMLMSIFVNPLTNLKLKPLVDDASNIE